VETYLVLKSDKKIVLLDEPFSHIAPLYIEQFKQLIELEKKDESHYLN
jgi:ABC-type lipopolysaccharide export system ATPase subunit